MERGWAPITAAFSCGSSSADSSQSTPFVSQRRDTRPPMAKSSTMGGWVARKAAYRAAGRDYFPFHCHRGAVVGLSVGVGALLQQGVQRSEVAERRRRHELLGDGLEGVDRWVVCLQRRAVQPEQERCCQPEQPHRGLLRWTTARGVEPNENFSGLARIDIGTSHSTIIIIRL